MRLGDGIRGKPPRGSGVGGRMTSLGSTSDTSVQFPGQWVKRETKKRISFLRNSLEFCSTKFTSLKKNITKLEYGRLIRKYYMSDWK